MCRGSINGQMEGDMWGIGRTIICMEEECTLGQMEGNMKVGKIHSFVGEYYMDKKHGMGRYTWADGRIYEGMWQNGKQHGEGKYSQNDGSIKLGLWSDGKRIKWLKVEKAEDKPTDSAPQDTHLSGT